MDLIVRVSIDDDVMAITAIYAHAVRYGTASFEREAPSAETMIERRRALLAGGYPFLVAERDGRVVGYAHAGPYRARPAYAWTVEDSVYVAPEAKGRGVGRALLAESEDRGFRPMVAVIGEAASHGSIGLHCALGFRGVGIFEGIGWKHGRWLSSVLMQRALGECAATPPRQSRQARAMLLPCIATKNRE